MDENTDIPEEPGGETGGDDETDQDAMPASGQGIPGQVIQEEAKRRLEALLFAAAEPMSIDALAARMHEGADIGALVMELARDYDGRGVVLADIGGRWAFRTAPDLGDSLTIERVEERSPSRAAMETLAIIAYHQPLTRAEIENIRGVATNKGTLDTLMEAGWVKPGRRRESPGRPLTWVTTNGFLDHFGLESLTDLPGLDELKAAGLLDRRPAIDAIPDMDDLFTQDADEDSTEEDGDSDYELDDNDD